MPGGLQPHKKGSPLRENMPALRAMLLGRAAVGGPPADPRKVKKNAALVTRKRVRRARPARAARPSR